MKLRFYSYRVEFRGCYPRKPSKEHIAKILEFFSSSYGGFRGVTAPKLDPIRYKRYFKYNFLFSQSNLIK